MRFINQDYRAAQLRGRAFKGDLFDPGGSEATIDPEIKELAKKGTFKPFTLTSSAGTATGTGGEDGLTLGYASSQPFRDIQGLSLEGTQQLLPLYLQQLGQAPQQFQFDEGIKDRAASIFEQQYQLLEPQFAQQRAQLQSDLFGSGRLGLRLAGDVAGAGAGGMVNPDAFGLARAQSQTLSNLVGQSRQQALGEQGQLFGQAAQKYGLYNQAYQDYLRNLSAGAGGLFNIGRGVTDQELNAIKLGLFGEQVRGGSFTDAASAISAGQTTESSGPGLGFSAISGFASGFGSTF